MLICTCKLTSTTPISFSRAYEVPKEQGESEDAYRARTWRMHIHKDEKTGEAYIPPTALKNCIFAASKYMNEKLKGSSTWSAKFRSGISVVEPIMLGVNADDIPPERLFLPSDGIAGSGKRVWKIYPTLPAWEATASIIVLDPIITPYQLHRYLEAAGQFIGMGRYRPEKNGYYGRFTVSDFVPPPVQQQIEKPTKKKVA